MNTRTHTQKNEIKEIVLKIKLPLKKYLKNTPIPVIFTRGVLGASGNFGIVPICLNDPKNYGFDTKHDNFSYLN